MTAGRSHPRGRRAIRDVGPIRDVGTELQFGPFERPVRLSRPRLQTFDYRGCYAHHVVVVVKDRIPVFDDIALGHWCMGVLEDVAPETGFEVLAFCFMPDHLHMLVEGMEDSSHLITLLQRFKQRTGFYFKKQSGAQLWQESYFDRVIRKEEDLGVVADYIFQNPVDAGLVGAPPEVYPLLGGTFADVGPSDRTEVPSLRLDS
jgi:putative transposase